jgi:hypothetical protein
MVGEKNIKNDVCVIMAVGLTLLGFVPDIKRLIFIYQKLPSGVLVWRKINSSCNSPAL